MLGTSSCFGTSLYMDLQNLIEVIYHSTAMGAYMTFPDINLSENSLFLFRPAHHLSPLSNFLSVLCSYR